MATRLIRVGACAGVACVAVVAAGAVATGANPHTVAIYAPRASGVDCARVFPLARHIAGRRVLRGAMQALLAGPTRSERARGYGGWFSTKTAGHLRSVRIVRGVAYIDFRSFARDIPNASSACGSTLLLAQLDRTAKQFRTVARTVYSFDGSPRAFYEWLQREPPQAAAP